MIFWLYMFSDNPKDKGKKVTIEHETEKLSEEKKDQGIIWSQLIIHINILCTFNHMWLKSIMNNVCLIIKTLLNNMWFPIK